jgi:hypothetical protein
MKLYKKCIILLLICVIFYLIGNWVPMQQLNPSIQKVQLKTPEYLQLIISFFAALVTLSAVIIALFKEDIRKFWEFSKIVISMPEDNFFEELNSSSSKVESKAWEAIKYNSKIEILNSGSIAALDLEIYLESLTFKGVEYPTSQIIRADCYLKWNELHETKINLSPEGKRTIDILELSSPAQQSSPGGVNTDVPAKLIIAGIEVNPDFKNGKWTGSFIIFSTNAKPIRFKLEVNWNGRWEKRASEMKSNLTTNLIK